MINENALHDLQSMLSKNTCVLAIVEGDEGIGKSTIIEKCKLDFLDFCIITVKEPYTHELPFSKIVFSLENVLSDSKRDWSVNKVGCYEEFVLNLFDSVCKEKEKVVFHFENFENFSTELREIIERFINKLLAFPENIIKFIVEINSKSNDFIKFQSLRRLADKNIIRPELLNLNEIIELMTNRYSCFDFTKEDIITLSEASFYNVGKLISLLEYLEFKKVIYYNQNWKCRNINRELIMEFFKSYIISRYDILSDANKLTLKKASIFDYYIDPNDSVLQSITKVKNLEESLETIQYISNLIVRFSNQYKFENHEVHLYILNQAEELERVEWNKLIGNSLVRSLNQNRFTNTDEVLAIQNRIAYHYHCAGEYDLSLSYYLSCIPLLFNHFNYNQVLKIIAEIDKIAKLSSKYNEEYNALIIGYKSQALFALGRYTEAIKAFEYLLAGSKFYCEYEKNIIEYYICNSYFNSGLEQFPLERLDNLRTKVMGIIKEAKYIEETYGYKLLLIDIFHLLSTIYGHVGKKTLSEKYYNWCIENSKDFITDAFANRYYTLLGKANRHYNYELSIDKMKLSHDYFSDKSIFEYARVTHNIGTEYMINGNIFEAEKYLLMSLDAFKKQSSNDLHYPLNNLGAVYSYQGQHEKALEYFNKASTFEKEFFSKIWIKMNIATCTKLLGNHNEAIEIYRTLLAEIENSKEDINLLKMYLHTNIGIYFYDRGNFIDAENYLNSAKEIRLNKLNSSFGVAVIDFYLLRIHEIETGIKAEFSPNGAYVKTCSSVGAFYGDFMFW